MKGQMELGHSMGAPLGPPQMIPADEMILETNTPICDGWCPQVPGETTETWTQVKITLYGNFIVGICGFMCFLQHKSLPPPIWDFRHSEPAGTGEFTCGFFSQVSCRYPLYTRTCAIPYGALHHFSSASAKVTAPQGVLRFQYNLAGSMGNNERSQLVP